MIMLRMLAYLAVILTTSNLFGQEYEIHLTRSSEVGDKYEMESISSKSSLMTISRQGQILQKNESSKTAELEGSLTVLGVDGGKTTKISLVVSRFMATLDETGNEHEVLAKGTQVIAQLEEGEMAFLVNGKRVAEEIAAILNDFFSFKKEKVGDDEVFGTTDHKKVGESWPVNSKTAAADFSSELGPISPENVKGMTKLENVMEIDGIKCLRINANLQISGAMPPLPPGMTLEKSAITATVAGDYPLDLKLDALSQYLSAKIIVETRGKRSPDDQEVTMSMSETHSFQLKQKPLKPVSKI